MTMLMLHLKQKTEVTGNDDKSLASDDDTSGDFVRKGGHSEGGIRRELSKRKKEPPKTNAETAMNIMRKHSIPSKIGSDTLNETILNAVRGKIRKNMKEYKSACIGG